MEGVPDVQISDPKTLGLKVQDFYKSIIPEEELQELMKEFGIDEERLRRWYDGFYTVHHNGKIPEYVFLKRYDPVKIMGNGHSGQLTKHIFRAMDTGRKGYITFRDLVKSSMYAESEDLKKQIEWTFDLYDVNGDDVITYDEVLEMCDATLCLFKGIKSKLPSERAEFIYKKIDEEDRGYVTREQYREVMELNPEFIDLFMCPPEIDIGAEAELCEIESSTDEEESDLM